MTGLFFKQRKLDITIFVTALEKQLKSEIYINTYMIYMILLLFVHFDL